MRGTIWHAILDAIRDATWDAIRDTIWDAICDTFRDAIQDGNQDAIRDVVRDDIQDAIRDISFLKQCVYSFDPKTSILHLHPTVINGQFPCTNITNFCF